MRYGSRYGISEREGHQVGLVDGVDAGRDVVELVTLFPHQAYS